MYLICVKIHVSKMAKTNMSSRHFLGTPISQEKEKHSTNSLPILKIHHRGAMLKARDIHPDLPILSTHRHGKAVLYTLMLNGSALNRLKLSYTQACVKKGSRGPDACFKPVCMMEAIKSPFTLVRP